MDQEKLKKLQNQYNIEEDEDQYDELFQENSEDMAADEEAVIIQPSKGAGNKLGGIITQVDQGSTQPKVVARDEIPSDFFVDDEIVIGPQRKSDKGKKTLWLDLDETLVHSSFQPVDDADLVLPVEIEGTCCEVYVLKRPGVDDFLKRLHKHYELIIYTASLSKYADPLLDWLDPKNYWAYRLFREHCTYFNGIFVKDLSRIDRDLKDWIIVDNSPTSYLFHPECALPTNSWYDDQNDMELYQLWSILERLSKVDDVRNYIKQFVANNKVNFNRAAQILKGGKLTERSNSEPPAESIHDKSIPIPQNPPSAPPKQYTKDERKPKHKVANHDVSKTTDERNKYTPNIMMNTWTPSNKNIEEQFKRFTMMNQYKAMGLNNMNTDMHKMLTNTLSSYNTGGRNQLNRDPKKSSKKGSRTRQHSANPKVNNSKRRKSPFRGRNDNSFGLKTSKLEDSNTLFLNLMKNSLKLAKSKHKKKKSNLNISNTRDSAIINSVHPQNINNLSGTSIRNPSGKQSRASNSPKRGVKYAKMFGRSKGGSTRVSRKGSAANSNERGSYTTYVSQRASPKSKKQKPSMDSNINSNSFKFNNMMKDMGITFNYNGMQPQYNSRSRQGVVGSKKSSLIDSVIGNVNRAKERAHKMYSTGTIHTPTPNNNQNFVNDSKFASDILMMNANNNHHTFKLTSTGRGKTPHQKPGSPKRRKNSGGKRSHSRPRSGKQTGVQKANTFHAKFFDPKALINEYSN